MIGMNDTDSEYYGEGSGGEPCPFPLLNLTDESTAEAYLLSFQIGRIFLIIMFIILAVGVPGNLVFLFVVFRLQHMRNVTNTYLTSLAIVDLTFLSISIFTYYFYFTNPVRTHLEAAKAVGCVGAFFLPYFTYFLSVSTVTLVTLDKYGAVCNPIKYIQRPNKRRAVRLIVGSWVVAVVLAGLVMLRFARLEKFCAVWPDKAEYQDLPVVLGYCLPVSAAGLIIGHLLEAIVFAVAVVTNVIMYGRIIMNLSARVSRKKRQQQTMPVQAMQVRNQVSRLLITFGAVFFLCQAPFVIISLAYIVDYMLGTPPSVTYQRYVLPLNISHVFVFLNSAVNPIIYNLTSRIYRQAFQQVIMCPSPCRSDPQKASTPSLSINVQGLENGGFDDMTQANELGLTDHGLSTKL